MADNTQTVGITPQDLLVRSNPAMYASLDKTEISSPRDMTNPREMYNILSYKTKSTEDFETRFKQELVKSFQTPGLLPKLSRTASMNEIRRSHGKLDRLGNKPFKSTSNLIHADKKLNVLVLTRNRTSIDDLRVIQEEDKENVLNLPNITRNSIGQGVLGLDGVKEIAQRQVGFPNLSEGRINTPTAGQSAKLKFDIQRQKLIRVKEELSASDSRLDKWFSEMPNEVFDKAQRALMEESIKDKLQTYQRKRNKKGHVPNQNVNVYVGTKMRKVPNTYLELHVDSFGKHLMNDTVDKMNKYKLQQKSMLKLKMRDLDEIDKMNRGHDDARPCLPQRSLTTLALTKPTTAQTPRQKNHVINVPTDRGLKTVNMNDRVELESEQRLRQHMTNYEEYTERLNIMKTSADVSQTQEQKNKENQENECPNSPASNEPEPGTTHENVSEKEPSKPKIVNIALKGEIPKLCIPIHIEKSMKELGTFVKAPLKDKEPDVNLVPDAFDKDLEADNEVDEDGDDDDDNNLVSKPEHITKIPTAQSRGTSESKSSSSSVSRANKSALKKFNTLEVFAESNKTVDAKMHRRNYNSHKIRDTEPKEIVPPVVKLDLKHYRHQQPVLLREDGGIPRNEVKKQDVVFRFEPGEIYISSRKTNQSHTYNRSSERARIIYGKVIHGKDEKIKWRDDLKDNTSINTPSTKIDGYRSEIGRFENRALDGSITSFSGRDDDGALNNMFINTSRNAPIYEGTETPFDRQETSTANTKTPTNDNTNTKGVQVRDMAVETDVIGSEKGSALQKVNTHSGGRSHSTKIKDTPRSGSGLSDFIVDNNDGESLESDTEDELYREAMSKHSV